MLRDNDQRYKEFLGKKELDFSYISDSDTPYRVNAYFAMGQVHIVLRKINQDAWRLEEIMFHDVAESVKKNILHRSK